MKEKPYTGNAIYSPGMKVEREKRIFTLLYHYLKSPTSHGRRVLSDALSDYKCRTLSDQRDSLLEELASSPEFDRSGYPEDVDPIDNLRDVDLEDFPELEPDEAA